GKARPFAQQSPGRVIWENVKGFAIVVVLFLGFRAFIAEAYRIPSGSMIPTLLVGDWLFVNKMVYGPHVPFTASSLPGYSDPKKGDVVVFVSPYQADEAAIGNDPTPTLVKRLIGTGGDTLYMRHAVLFVNGVESDRPASAIDPVHQTAAQPDLPDPLFAWQSKYALLSSRFGAAPAQPSHDSWGPIVVPAGHFFMMGDNRYDSKDSRYWGFVPRENVRGRPMFVYFSYNADDSDRPLPWITDIRWSRLGHWIR
ncbi:MAG: signal peptidase I, partial [Gemmatimonadota bacterium]|nr:signal peptidase I [Gemmatimonadota bacterium]